MNITSKYTVLAYLLGIIIINVLVFTTTSCSDAHNQENLVRRYTFSLPSGIVINTLNNNKITLQSFETPNNTFVILDAPSDHNYTETLQLLDPDTQQILNTVKPLQRIYKMDQQKEYAAKDGQLLSKHKNTKRYVLTLEIVNDPELREEYIEIHGIGKAWPQITNNMKEMGIKDMELYLDGYRAYLIMDTRKDFDMDKDGEKWSKLPREAEWQQYVSKFQKVDPLSKATEKWKTMNIRN